MAELVHVHVRLSPQAAGAWGETADRLGVSITALAEAVGQSRIRALGREPRVGSTARQVDEQRKRRPGPRGKGTKNP